MYAGGKREFGILEAIRPGPTFACGARKRGAARAASGGPTLDLRGGAGLSTAGERSAPRNAYLLKLAVDVRIDPVRMRGRSCQGQTSAGCGVRSTPIRRPLSLPGSAPINVS